VDLTDGLQKFMIFRVEKDPEDRWSIIEQDGFRMQEFDQFAFEKAFDARPFESDSSGYLYKSSIRS
jgi:hypothetical protein